jgi:hypothetical protein
MVRLVEALLAADQATIDRIERMLRRSAKNKQTKATRDPL